jgi:hypothetical protein
MSTFSSMLDDACHTETFHWMDLVSVGHDSHDSHAGAAHAELTLNTIVAIPDIYGNSALLKQDPAQAYGTAADNFAPRMARKLNLAV